MLTWNVLLLQDNAHAQMDQVVMAWEIVRNRGWVSTQGVLFLQDDEHAPMIQVDIAQENVKKRENGELRHFYLTGEYIRAVWSEPLLVA